MSHDLSDVQPYTLMHTEQMRKLRSPINIIEGFLPSGGVMGLTSYPGVGKTWFVMDVMKSVTTGDDFLGKMKVNIPGAVLFVGNDASEYDYARQWTRLTRDIPDERLRHAWFLCQSGFMLDDNDAVDRLIKTSMSYVVEEDAATVVEDDETGEERTVIGDRVNFEVIICDTLSRLCYANQNDNTEMENVFRNVRRIAEETGAAVILLHHNSKPNDHNEGTDWRGAMSQIGALDSWVQLTKQKRSKADALMSPNSYLVSAQFKKFRGITPPDFGFRLNVGDPERASLTVTEEPITLQDKLASDELASDLYNLIKAQPRLTRAAYKNVLWIKHKENSKSLAAFGKAIENRTNTLIEKKQIRKFKEDGETVYEVVPEKEEK